MPSGSAPGMVSRVNASSTGAGSRIYGIASDTGWVAHLHRGGRWPPTVRQILRSRKSAQGATWLDDPHRGRKCTEAIDDAGGGCSRTAVAPG